MATTSQIEAAARATRPPGARYGPRRPDGALGGTAVRDALLARPAPRDAPREFHDDHERDLLTVRPWAEARERLAAAEDAAT